jgi:hypothetical protein
MPEEGRGVFAKQIFAKGTMRKKPIAQRRDPRVLASEALQKLTHQAADSARPREAAGSF